uniref:Uncharacterized protein n=1 Tax=Anguilla anguilla TaxID=7936 RepID=A0A0E9QM96_ANGAN
MTFIHLSKLCASLFKILNVVLSSKHCLSVDRPKCW